MNTIICDLREVIFTFNDNDLKEKSDITKIGLIIIYVILIIMSIDLLGRQITNYKRIYHENRRSSKEYRINQ